MHTHRIVRTACASALVAAVGFGGLNPAFGATLLDFPSPSDYADGRLYAWRWGSSYLMENHTQGPFTFSYAVDDAFLANQAPHLMPWEAKSIVANALESWTIASDGWFTFEEAPWPAVRNIGAAPPDQWEGPSLEDWLAGDYPDVFPGWGANIEFFSVPAGFTLNSQGVQYQMNSSTLAFTVVNRIGATHIVSVDIYLNQNFTWTDAVGAAGDGNAQPPESAAFDLTTVILHELGHAFGLDHPNQASQNGSWNLDPYTFQPGAPWSPQDLMYAFYQGPRDQPTIDEVGGVAFLYGLQSPLDLTGTGTVGGGDLAVLLANWGSVGIGSQGDLNYDGVVDATDLTILLANFGLQLDGAPTGQPVHAGAWDDPASLTPVEPIIIDCYHVTPHGEGDPH